MSIEWKLVPTEATVQQLPKMKLPASVTLVCETLVTCADVYREMVAAAPLPRAADTPLALVARMEQFLKWVDYHYDNQDINHVDFRVGVARMAREILAGMGPESFTPGNPPSGSTATPSTGVLHPDV